MQPVAALALSLLVLGGARAEVVYSNLNTDPDTTGLAYGFTQFAQRFTTASAGSGLRLDMNIIALFGPETYGLELWIANGPGTDLDALLATIGSGTVSTADTTALTSFDLTYGLAASTNYFVRLTTSADVGWVLGPSSSASLNSVFRYGVASLNNVDTSIAGAMQVDVVAVPEPATAWIAIAGLAGGGLVVALRLRPGSARSRGR